MLKHTLAAAVFLVSAVHAADADLTTPPDAGSGLDASMGTAMGVDTSGTMLPLTAAEPTPSIRMPDVTPTLSDMGEAPLPEGLPADMPAGIEGTDGDNEAPPGAQ